MQWIFDIGRGTICRSKHPYERLTRFPEKYEHSRSEESRFFWTFGTRRAAHQWLWSEDYPAASVQYVAAITGMCSLVDLGGFGWYMG